MSDPSRELTGSPEQHPRPVTPASVKAALVLMYVSAAFSFVSALFDLRGSFAVINVLVALLWLWMARITRLGLPSARPAATVLASFAISGNVLLLLFAIRADAALGDLIFRGVDIIYLASIVVLLARWTAQAYSADMQAHTAAAGRFPDSRQVS